MKPFVTLFVTLAAAMFVSVKVSGQDTTIPFDAHSAIWGGMFAPEGPEATALTRYGEDAPDFYHGSLKLSIPVYTWKDNLFEILPSHWFTIPPASVPVLPAVLSEVTGAL
ncbi:MAG: hypothetical protein IJU68_07170 [Bacteroidales bacterium]|nr:hypothetical protein [Bacteroidales bacterium]